jgi:hypothetical protein
LKYECIENIYDWNLHRDPGINPTAPVSSEKIFESNSHHIYMFAQGYTPAPGSFSKNVAGSSQSGISRAIVCLLSLTMSYPKLYLKKSSGVSALFPIVSNRLFIFTIQDFNLSVRTYLELYQRG